MGYLSATAVAYAGQSADQAGKLAMAVEAAGRDAHAFGGIDLVHLITDTWYSPTLGAFGVPTNTYHQAYPILGLAAAGESVPLSATQNLSGLQQADGGWKYDLGPQFWNTTGPDHTGLALQALIAAGVPAGDPVIRDGVDYLQSQQDAQGSWSLWGSASVNSTAYAIQGLLAAGEDLESGAWLKQGHSPLNALAGLQKSDGPFVQGVDDDLFSTRQAIPALLGVYTPFAPGGLVPFVGVYRGLDPDRIVPGTPRAVLGNSVDLLLPFGSDLDRDAVVTLTYRIDGGAWQPTALRRGDGFFTATIGHQGGVYDLRALFTDGDGVQGERVITETGAIAIHQGFVPLTLKDD
jgi:hypothetical protein